MVSSLVLKKILGFATGAMRGVAAGRRSRVALTASVVALAGLGAAGAQTQQPLPLPNTITTVAGGGSTYSGATATNPVACAAGSPYKAYDSYGNGCPGTLNNFSSDLRGGLASDGAGNIYIADTSNSMVRKYDPKTGIVSRVVGKGTNCTSGLLDSSGDGCPAQQTSLASTPRGIATDPYGNLLIAGYGTNMVHVVCNAVSPLCPATTNRKQIGSMYRVAGCVGTTGGGATGPAASATNATAGSEGDNSPASPYNNLSGDAAVYGSTAGAGTCGSTVGGVNQPRGVGADRYGNVYIGETGTGSITSGAGLRYRVVLGPQTYNGVTNPLWAIINGASYIPYGATATSTYTAHEGYIYTILGGFATSTVPAKGASCGASVAEDALGDGCPFTQSSANGGVQGVAADSYGNVYFSDTVNSVIRVLYAGGANNPTTAAIVANSGGAITSPVAGNVYLLAGKGATAISATATLGSATTLSNQAWKIQVGPNNNLYLGDDSTPSVWFYDMSTGYIRQLFKPGTVCTGALTTNGDGCPATQASYSGGSSAGFGVAVDPLGNLYIGDIETSSLIRKVEALSLVPLPVGTSLTQTLKFHLTGGNTTMTATAVNAPADIVPGTTTCGAANADGTVDCSLPVTFAPTQPGNRTMNLATTVGGTTTLFPVGAIANGTALVTDTATPAVSSVSLTSVTGLAIDGASNLYTVLQNTHAVSKITSGTASQVGTAPANATSVAVDNSGNVYVATAGGTGLTQFKLNANGSYTTGTVTNAAIAQPVAAAFDAVNNAYVLDGATKSLYLVPVNLLGQPQPTVAIASGFTSPVGVAIDGSGNLYVADSGAGVYKVTNVNGTYTSTLYAAASGGTVTVSGLVPVSVAADAAGNVYVQDSTSKSVIMVSASTASATTVLSGLTAPSGVAVDGNGVVYSTDSSANLLTQVQRNQLSFNFGSNINTVFAGTITNAGNQTATGYQAAGLDTSDFPVTSVSPSNCFNSTAIYPGASCSVTSQFTPGSGTGQVSSTIAFAPAASTTGYLKFTGTKTGAAVTTTTTIGAATPANPVYSASGTEVTFPVSVAASDSSTATGSVNVSVDSGTSVAYTLSNGTVNVALSGLSAGNHTIQAVYPTQAGLTGSSSTTVNFTIAQAATTVNWTPGATTQQFSAAIGTSVLDATAVVSGTSTAVPGYFLYTATPSGGGTAVTVHAASYLPIGTYSLAVTFVPTDATDYTGNTASVASYTVTKATTTAGLGATQMLVAADGTGNYSDVQSAVNALPSGGNIYIKPGTYVGDVSVVQPNVALRGLGGDPTQVILTHASGSFSNNPGSGYMYAGEFQAGTFSNGHQMPSGSSVYAGDEGSATLVVDTGVNTALSTASQRPNNFYAENLSLINTYDSDPTTTTTTYLSGGVCTANAGPAQTYSYLYNNGQECASQALAIWTRSDLSVMNNVYTASLQDTIYAGSQGAPNPARQYWFRGRVTGDVDYIFGDAAAVFDYTTIYSAWHSTATGTVTIEAQNKANLTGGTSDYLSGYVMNSNVFTSQSTGMTQLYLGRPYGKYSTWIMLNSYVDQTNALGYTEFSGQTNLPTSTYAEYNSIPYTDPAVGAADLNGVVYQYPFPVPSGQSANPMLVPTGGNTGTGVTGTRETTSASPGTPMANNAVKTSMTAAQATLYYPTAFLSTPVASSTTNVTSWNPTAALASYVNAFATGGTATSINGGSSVTLLLRPQTPGLGAVTYGTYTIPTGTYTLTDTVNGNTTTIATGSLDAAGEAYYTTSALAVGTHSLSWTYSGDANFSGSTSTAYTLTVNGTATATSLSAAANPITYGQSDSVTATVTAGGTAVTTGTVTFTVDGTAQTPVAVNGSGQATLTLNGLTGSSTGHTVTAAYNAGTTYAASTSSQVAIVVNAAPLTINASCANRLFDQANNCTLSVTGYVNGDSASTVFTSGPTLQPGSARTSAPGNYTVSVAYAMSSAMQANYSVTTNAGTYTVSGGAPQIIVFPALPTLTQGNSYQLTAHASSGLGVTYTVTGGSATVSGSTLTVTGPGTITVQAAQSGSSAYAAATSVSRSFNAQ